MDYQENTELFEAWKFFSFVRKLILRSIGAAIVLFIVLYFFTCNTASGQERAVLVSSDKVKFSTLYRVVVKAGCNVYESKWNSHRFRGKDAVIPKTWDVVKVRNRFYIKPVL